MADSPARVPHRGALLSTAWWRALAAYAVAAVLLLLVGRNIVGALVNTWTHTTTYHHGFIVLPICLFLIWRQRRRFLSVEPSASALGVLCLLPFGVLWVLGAAGDIIFFQEVGLVGLLAALVPALMGWTVARILWFPLVFAFAMVPFGDEFVPALQDITAVFSVRLLRLTGIPVFHEGVFIQTPTGLFEVAEACAGLRFLIANLVVAFLFCHFSYRKWWKWVAFMLVALIIPIIANGLRAFGIIYIAYQTDNEVAVGVDHLVYGWGFFTLVMLISLFVGNLFADSGMGGLGTVEPQGRGSASGARRAGVGLPFAALAIAVALIGPVWSWLMHSAAAADDQPIPSIAAPGWPESENPGTWTADFPAADVTSLGQYRVEGAPVELYVAYYRYQRQGAELIHHGNRLYPDDWIRLGTQRWSAEIDGTPAPAEVIRLARGDSRRLVAVFYWIDGAFADGPLDVKLRQTLARIQLREPPVAAIVVSTPFDEGVEAGLARIQLFLDKAGPVTRALSAANRAN